MKKSEVSFSGYDKWIVPNGKKLPELKEKTIRTVDDPEYLTKVIPSVGIMIRESDVKANVIKLERNEVLSIEIQNCIDSLYVTALESGKKVSTVKQMRNVFNNFIKTITPYIEGQIFRITLSMFAFYNSNISESVQKTIRSVLVFWINNTNYPGISEELEHYLRYSKSPKPRSTLVIQATTPNERPFSKGQIHNIQMTIESLYIEGIFNAQNYCLWKLAAGEAIRMTQLSLLLVSDFKVSGGVVYGNVPIIRQQGMRGRDYMFNVKFSASVSGAIISQLDFIKSVSGGEDTSDYPLFCIIKSKKTKSWVAVKRRLNLNSQFNKSRKLIIGSNVNSEIKNEMELFIRRLKHTKLTDLAIRGADAAMLARAGFQTSTSSLKHYINESPDCFDTYQRQMLDVHEMINSAFRGAVVKEEECTNKDADHSVLNDDASENLGSCSADICGVLSPDGCYLCSKFQAFKEANHKELYDRILSRKNNYITNNANPSVIARDDNILLAVKKVIDIIEADKGVHV